MKKIIKLILSSLTVFFFLASIVLLVFGAISIQQNSYIRLFDHSYSVVGSGSMEPEIMTGEFIIIKYVPYEDVYQMVEEGKQPIIAFKGDLNIVHRAIRIENNQIVTKGDANPREDDLRVDASNYIGLVTTHFMLLDVGYISLNYKNAVFLIIVLILLFILIKEFINIIKIINHKKEAELLERHEQEKHVWIEAEKERLRNELETEMKAKQKQNSDL